MAGPEEAPFMATTPSSEDTKLEYTQSGRSARAPPYRPRSCCPKGSSEASGGGASNRLWSASTTLQDGRSSEYRVLRSRAIVPSKAPQPPRDAFTTEATLHALQDISVATTSAHDPVTVAELAVERARTLTGADGAVVFAYDAPTRLLLPLFETQSAVEEAPVRPGQGAIGMAFKSGVPVVVDDYRTWKHAVPQSQVRGMVSALAVPLLSDDRPTGRPGRLDLRAPPVQRPRDAAAHTLRRTAGPRPGGRAPDRGGAGQGGHVPGPARGGRGLERRFRHRDPGPPGGRARPAPAGLGGGRSVVVGRRRQAPQPGGLA